MKKIWQEAHTYCNLNSQQAYYAIYFKAVFKKLIFFHAVMRSAVRRLNVNRRLARDRFDSTWIQQTQQSRRDAFA